MRESAPGREIFLEIENKDSQNTDKMLRRFRRDIDEAENEKGTEIKEFIKDIDFEALRNIFAEEYEQAGLDPSKMNFVAPEHIYSNGGLSNLGVYRPEANLIGINAADAKNYATKHQFDQRLLLLHSLIHEEDHAVQKVECHVGKNEYDDFVHDGYIRQRRGPEVSMYGNKELTRFFWAFGEGVTDKMALEITAKYANKKRFADDKSIEEFKDGLRQHGPYAWNQHVVDVFISKLSHSTGLSADVVWGAIKAGALRGDDLYKGELREFLDSELGEEFMGDLEKDAIVKKKVIHDRSKSEQRWRDAKTIVLKMVRKLTR